MGNTKKSMTLSRLSEGRTILTLRMQIPAKDVFIWGCIYTLGEFGAVRKFRASLTISVSVQKTRSDIHATQHGSSCCSTATGSPGHPCHGRRNTARNSVSVDYWLVYGTFAFPNTKLHTLLKRTWSHNIVALTRGKITVRWTHYLRSAADQATQRDARAMQATKTETTNDST